MTSPTRPANEPTSIVQDRLMPASPEEVFAAWSDAEGMAAWMCPGEDMERSRGAGLPGGRRLPPSPASLTHRGR